MRLVLALLALAAGLSAAEPARVLQAVEFPYYLYPRTLWERELVWLKSIGVRTVAFSIPPDWHHPQGAADYTGATSPRRDLTGLLRVLRRLELRAWVRPRPLAAVERRAVRGWPRELTVFLEPHTAAHGGPIAFAEGGFPNVPAPPAPVVALDAAQPGGLARSRHALASARGSLLWENVETALWPAGWQPAGAGIMRRGAIGFDGAELPSAAALRRDAALMREWSALFGALRPLSKPRVRPALGAFPAGLSAAQLVSRAASAVSIVNQGAKLYSGDLRVYDPVARRSLVIPSVQVPQGEALWLPVHVSLAAVLCRSCAGLGDAEHIVYATAELQALEYENGILAMEFAAPVKGEAVLQLARKPAGPYLAAGRLTEFEFDEKTLRARLPVPAGSGAGHRVRVGLAIEAPESSGFFVDARRLILGRRNVITTQYSSDQIAARSRLRLPEGFTARPVTKPEAMIEYEVTPPADALHGDWANFALEADGVLLGRARLQLFRPLSVRLAQAVPLHFGAEELPADPPVVAIDPKAGRNIDVVLRNNSPHIETFKLEASGEGLEFFPARTEISIGPVMERTVGLRVFGEGAGLREWRLHVAGGASLDLPMRVVLAPRNQTVTWSSDLDGDGSPEWVIENQRARAVFSPAAGGRWLEYTWKDTGRNVLPENGALAGGGPAAARALEGSRLEIGNRTITLAGNEARLTVEQATPLPPETLKEETRDGVTLKVTRESANRAVYVLSKQGNLLR